MNIESIFKSGLTYPEYRNLVDKLIQEGKTTGNTQTTEKVEFTKLNIQRMNRLDKTVHLPEQAMHIIKNIAEPMLWLLIGDAWCGDCAQIIPIVNKLAAANKDKITLKIISRDSDSELVQTELHGSISIPKLLAIDPHTMEVICSWGPRPMPAQQIMQRWKESDGKISKEDFEKELHLWYAKDKGATTINELVMQMEKCESKISQFAAV